MLLPFPALINVQIQKRKKLVLLGLLATGVFITVIQIFRIQTVVRLANYLDSAPLIMWSAIENNLGVIVACIPTLSPLIRYFSERSRTGTGTGGQTGGSKAPPSKSGGGNAGSFALQSWRGRNSGLVPLGSGVDHEFGKGDSDTASTEMILEHGIVKKTDVVVTSDPVLTPHAM